MMNSTSGCFLLWNPTTMTFYAYPNTFYGMSKTAVDKAVNHINQLQEENAKMKEILKKIDVSQVDSEVVKMIMEL